MISDFGVDESLFFLMESELLYSRHNPSPKFSIILKYFSSNTNRLDQLSIGGGGGQRFSSVGYMYKITRIRVFF